METIKQEFAAYATQELSAKQTDQYFIQYQSMLNVWHDLDRVNTMPKAKAKLKRLQAEYKKSPTSKAIKLRCICREVTTVERQIWFK